MANLSHYLTPAIAAVATAASLASATIGQNPAGSAEPINQLTAAEKKAGWILLFDGKSLNGWRGYKKTDTAGTRWQVEDGLLTVNPGNGSDTRGALDIITAVQFDRFDLTWEWRIAEGGNSGLKYFVLEDLPSAIGHEYQLIDDERHADAKVGPHRQTAALYDVLPAQNRPLKPAGQFNQSRIVSNGTTVEHYLNGTRVLQYELDSPALREAIAKSKFKDVERFGKPQNGLILLQDHGDAVCYRNVKIRAGNGTS
jgi:3-keto-disaccharide hydrolase